MSLITYSVVIAWTFHFNAASYFEPPASLLTKWVLANMPLLAFFTKNSCVLKQNKTLSVIMAEEITLIQEKKKYI